MRVPRTLFASLIAVGMVVLPFASAGASPKALSARPAASSPTIVIGNEGFTESDLLQYIYGDLLKNAGFKVSYQSTASRAVAIPALEAGHLDLLPDYAGSLLIYLDKTALKQAGTLSLAAPLLNSLLSSKGAEVLAATQGLDQNVFVVTQATKAKYHLTTISSLKPYASKLVFGAPPECPTYYFCETGLKNIYGLTFKQVKAYDEGGPLTVKALQTGAAQVVELFSTESVIGADNFYQLTDNLNLEPADHLIPVIRKSFVNAKLTAALASVNKDLTTSVLTQLDAQPGEGSHPSIQAVAEGFLMTEKLIS